MGTRVLSLWLPYLAIDRIRRESRCSTPGQRSLPGATYLENVEGQPLIALCARAEQAGLLPGMSRAEALKRVPGLTARPSDPKETSQPNRVPPFGSISATLLIFQAAKPACSLVCWDDVEKKA